MWKEFDLSSVSYSTRAIIWVPNIRDAEILLDELGRKGVRWKNGELPTSDLRWDRYGEETCYFIKRGVLTYSDRVYAEQSCAKDIMFLFSGNADRDISPVSSEDILKMLW